MATVMYPKGKQHFLQGDILWKASAGSTIRCILVDSTTDAYDSANEYFSDLTAGSLRGNSGGNTYADGGALTLIDPTNGVADANDVTLTGVTNPGSTDYEAVIIYRDGGSAAASELIAWVDNATGLPVTPNGGNITITWDNGANKIFALTDV